MDTEIGPKGTSVFAEPMGCTKTEELSHRACKPESFDRKRHHGAILLGYFGKILVAVLPRIRGFRVCTCGVSRVLG